MPGCRTVIPAMASPAPGRLDKAAQVFAVVLLGYWTAYVLAAPVTVWDSHTYNLSRLVIAWHGGLFGNTAWNYEVQAAYPWTFDALHYPLVRLGWAVALPSFLCFLGSLLIVRLRLAGTAWEPCFWWCALAWLALPTFMFQATSTKNDVAVLFGVASWYYAYTQWTEKRSVLSLIAMAIALGFTAGAKSLGLLFDVPLIVFTGWQLVRRDRRHLTLFGGALLSALVLFGSVEIYMNNMLLFRRPLGGDLARRHSQADGLAGAAANFVRYIFGSAALGDGASPPRVPLLPRLEGISRATLGALGLANRGYRWDFSDENLEFLGDGSEAGSNFGVFGLVSLAGSLLVFVRMGTGSRAWRLAATGLLALSIVCAGVVWMPWNMRFLVVPFALFGVNAGMFFGERRRHPALRAAGLILMGFCATAYPLLSLNKGPQHIVLSLRDREAMEFKEFPAMRGVYDEVRRQARRAARGTVLLVHAGGDAWTLPFLASSSWMALPTPQLTAADIRAHAERYPDADILVLVMNLDPDRATVEHLELIRAFPDAGSLIYRIRRGTTNGLADPVGG
jgi:hypothetical protein